MQCGTLQQRTKHHVFRSGGRNLKTLTRMLSWNGKWVFWSWWGRIIWQRMRFRSMNAYLICLGFFFSFFLYVFKKKTRWPMFFLLTCERVGNNSGRQSNGRVLVPLDAGHFPLYLWTLVFSNGHFSKTSVPQQWKPSVLLRAICTFLHMWCLWAVILRGSFMCDKMSRCNSILYLLPELKAKKALLMCDY